MPEPRSAVRGIVPHLSVGDMGAAHAWYVDVVGLRPATTLGWFTRLVSPDEPTAALTLTAGSGPDRAASVTIEVSDVEAVYRRALRAGTRVVRPPWNEPAEVRRLLLEDPDGRTITLTSPQHSERRRDPLEPPARAVTAGPGVLVLTGSPGTGKTTLAHLVTARVLASVHLRGDDFWRCIRLGWIAPYLPESHHQNQVVMDVLSEAAARYAAGGYLVVVDGVVGPWLLEPFRAAAARHAVPLHYLVLRADEETTLARARGRGAGELTDEAPLRAMYAQFADLGEYECHVLDTADMSEELAADLVCRGLESGTYRLDLG